MSFPTEAPQQAGSIEQDAFSKKLSDSKLRAGWKAKLQQLEKQAELKRRKIKELEKLAAKQNKQLYLQNRILEERKKQVQEMRKKNKKTTRDLIRAKVRSGILDHELKKMRMKIEAVLEKLRHVKEEVSCLKNINAALTSFRDLHMNGQASSESMQVIKERVENCLRQAKKQYGETKRPVAAELDRKIVEKEAEQSAEIAEIKRKLEASKKSVAELRAQIRLMNFFNYPSAAGLAPPADPIVEKPEIEEKE